MAWSRDRVDSSNINNGNEYQKGDRVSRQQLNAMVNAGLYSQDFVEALTETPVVNNEEVNANPTVNLIPYEKNGKGFYKFEFNNIKGKTGETGPAGTDGRDGTNGLDGESANISSVTAELSNEAVDKPVVDVQLGGTPLERTFHFVFKGILGGGGGSAILYDELGENTNGALTQKKSTEELNKKPNFVETEEVTITVNRLLDLIYPINSIRMSDNGNEQSFMGGTWIITGQGRTIIGAGSLGDNNYSVGDLIPAGLPNIEGSFRLKGDGSNAGVDAPATGSGPFIPVNGTGSGSNVSASNWNCGLGFDFDASQSNPIYGKSNTVHMNSFVTYIYKRIG